MLGNLKLPVTLQLTTVASAAEWRGGLGDPDERFDERVRSLRPRTGNTSLTGEDMPARREEG